MQHLKDYQIASKGNANDFPAVKENSYPKENAAEKFQHAEIKNSSSIDVQQSITDYNISLFGNLSI